MLQMDSVFFNVESIYVFNLAFLDICSVTSYPFGFPSRSKRPPLEILKFIVTKLSNQDKIVAFIQVDEDGELAIYSGFMNTCHNMNIIVKNIGGDAFSLNGKSESPNKTLSNITRDILLNSSHKKEPWCFAYQYYIWISQGTDKIFHNGDPYFLWHETRP